MADDEKDGRTVRMYDRPAGADKPPLGRMVLIIAIVLLLALLAARFVFGVHFGHLLHAGH